MREGRKVLFKPNLVSPSSIDAATHGEGKGNIACTQWPCVAALMRWFHDRLDIGYHEMALGEAGTGVAGTAAFLTALHGGGERITPEALIEGRRGDFCGGWGFYFVRQYLRDRHEPTHGDDPRNGYAESVSG